MVERHFHDIFFNGKSLADYGVHVSGDGVFNSPEKDYESVEVPGRNGDLHIFNERFKNVDVTYKAFIIGDDYPSNYGESHYDDARSDKAIDFKARMRSLRAWLMYQNGYCRLEDTYHPDEYRKAIFKGPLTTEAQFLQAGEFDLTFNCMPQRFLKSGEFPIAINNGSVIHNPTFFTSKPNIRVYGSGTLVFTDIDDYQTAMTVTSNPNEYMDIDSEISDAHYGTTNCNGYIAFSTLDFPVLKAGATVITYSGFRKVELTPRWWTI